MKMDKQLNQQQQIKISIDVVFLRINNFLFYLKKQQKCNVSDKTKAVLVDGCGYNVLVNFLLFT